jgi:hypothetical protein
MIITELDKSWCRAATAKLLRHGKLKRQPCEVCGARETLVHHIDYSNPEHIRWLCKLHKSQENLSPLQRSLLRRGLLAYHYRSLDSGLAGSFKLGSLITKFEDRSERAARRAAAGLSLKRLDKRGLLEHCARGSWRLTHSGVALARRLYPECKPPTKAELARDTALSKTLSELRQRLAPRKRAKRPVVESQSGILSSGQIKGRH